MENVIAILGCVVLIFMMPILVIAGMMLLPIAIECYEEAKEKLKTLKRKRSDRK